MLGKLVAKVNTIDTSGFVLKDKYNIDKSYLEKKIPDTSGLVKKIFFFFYLGFLSRTFTIHGTAGEGGGYLFNSSLPLPPASQTLRH